MALLLIRFIPPFTNGGHFGICQVVIKTFFLPPYISRFSYYKKQVLQNISRSEYMGVKLQTQTKLVTAAGAAAATDGLAGSVTTF